MDRNILGRRDVLLGACALGATLASGPVVAAEKPKIGLIGAGRIGGTLARLWADAGYQVMLSAQDTGPLQALAATIGHGVEVGAPRQAAAFGDVVVISVPYGALAQVGRDYAAELNGKIVLDTCNPKGQDFIARSPEASKLGTGIMDQRYLAGTRLVKAFNTVNFGALKTQGGRAGELAGVPLSADDQGALTAAEQLVKDAGFEPVVAGNLATAKLYDSYTPFHANGIPASKVRALLDLLKEIQPYE